MNLKPAIKYQLRDFVKGVGIFYLVIYLIILFLYVLVAVQINDSDSNISGLETATFIFLFVAGLNSFKNTFKLFLQNGLSRKTLFVSFSIAALAIAFFMDVVDSINHLLLQVIMPSQSIFDQIYSVKYVSQPSYVRFFDKFVWFLFLYVAMLFLGYFVTSLYYRMNKWQKLAISIGVPVFLFMILPLIDTVLTHGAIFTAIQNFLIFAMGFSSGGINPYIFVLTCIVSSVIFGGLSLLLGRRAMIKE